MPPGSSEQSVRAVRRSSQRFPAVATKPSGTPTSRADNVALVSEATSSDDAENLQAPCIAKFVAEQEERFGSVFSCNVPYAETHDVIWSTRKLIPLATSRPLQTYAALWFRNVGMEPPSDRQIVTFRRDVTLIRWSYDHALDMATRSIGDLRSAM